METIRIEATGAFKTAKVRITTIISPLTVKNTTNGMKVEVEMVIKVTEKFLQDETLSTLIPEEIFRIFIKTTASNRLLIKMSRQLKQGTPMVI